MSSEQLYTASEAARAFGISLDTLRRWDRNGRIRTQRDNANRRLVPASEVRRLQGRPTDELAPATASAAWCERSRSTASSPRVELDVTAPARVVAIITREAAEELDLRPERGAIGDRQVDLGDGRAMISRRLFTLALALDGRPGARFPPPSARRDLPARSRRATSSPSSAATWLIDAIVVTLKAT